MSARDETHSDESNLGDSAYEFVDTDEESRDDNTTESVASTDFGRPDDVASLADTERSEEESEDESSHAASSIPAFVGLDDPAASTPTIGCSAAISHEELDKPLAQSIEFEEPFSLGAENISVKHTVADFNEEQTARIVQGLMVQSPPKRLVATIRQTMTKQGLSTRDPLRILYVGSHSAKQDIIHKIASSVTASVRNGTRAQCLRHSPSQLYNVVPVTAFGSERTPEIELMHSSGYQINVEDCTYAQNLKYEDEPEKPDVIKLTLEDNFSYHSVPEGQGFIIEPHWELPHIAVFYCSDCDDIDARRTRTYVRTFMSRHGIPSIVISHKQLFGKSRCMSLDQHSIHMCLESRDPNGRGNIIHQRLPIDLASFLNIDARQMNRNLAYLTGLHEAFEVATPPVVPKKAESPLVYSQDLEKISYSISDSVNYIRTRAGAEWRALLPVGVLLLSVFAALLTGIPNYRSTSAPAISINSKVTSTVPISAASSNAVVSTPSITTPSTSIAVKTSTRTVTVTQSKAPGPNSLAVLPFMEIGKLPQMGQSFAKPVNRSTLCKAEVLGDREILIRIPSATKLSWLTKEAMSVNITRDNITVDTERAYISDDGIVLLLPQKEAHGVLNVSIITIRKPRVNETFQVDFRTNRLQELQEIFARWSTLFTKDVKTIESSAETAGTWTAVQLRMVAEKIAGQAQISSRVEEAKRAAMRHAASAGLRLTEAAKSLSVEAAKRSAILTKELGIQLSEAETELSKQLRSLHHLREPLDNGVLIAQVRSRLLWLKLRGKHEEYQEYKQRAALATRRRAEETRKSRHIAAEQRKKADRAAKKAVKREARTGKKSGKKYGKKTRT